MSGNTYGRTQQRPNGTPTVKSIMAKENGPRRDVWVRPVSTAKGKS
jgi:hypothetical protein